MNKSYLSSLYNFINMYIGIPITRDNINPRTNVPMKSLNAMSNPSNYTRDACIPFLGIPNSFDNSCNLMCLLNKKMI